MEFIDWAIQDVEENFEERRSELERAFYDFWSQPKEVIIYLLKNKLERGKREHGDVPNYTDEQLRKEFQDEQVDELGYLEVDQWKHRVEIIDLV